MRRDVSFVKLGLLYNIIAKGYVINLFQNLPQNVNRYICVLATTVWLCGVCLWERLWRIDVLTGVINCPCRKGCRVSVSQSGVRELCLRGLRFVHKEPASWINSTQQSIKVFFLRFFCIRFCYHYWQEKKTVLQSALHWHT